MNDDVNAESDDGAHGGDGDKDRGLGRTGLLQNSAFMGEQSADIVIGALQKVGLCASEVSKGDGPL